MNNRKRAFARMYIVNGIEQAEKYANLRKPMVNVGSGSFQVWIREDKASCFRAYRALLNS